MARIGIFSGTFDPVHHGHVAFCKVALAEAALDTVLFLPEPEPRRKVQCATLAHRTTMLELALQNEPQLQVLQLASRRFTVAETLPELRRHFPQDELFLLLGSDVVQSFREGWPDVATLLQDMSLIIGLRAGDSRAGVAQALVTLQQQLPSVTVRATIVSSPHAAAASSGIRERGSLGEPIHHLAPAVAAYIATHQLYAFS